MREAWHTLLKIYAWIILDNHFHYIPAAPDLTRVLADLKRHTARRIIEQLENEGSAWLLHQLRYFRLAHKSESSHQVWQEGSHPRAMMSDQMIEQKLKYLHDNPVKRGLVASPEHWRYSSAHEWLPGRCRCCGWTRGVKGAKCNFDDKCVPKCNLGTRSANVFTE